MSNTIARPRLEAFYKQAGLCYYCKSRMWLKDIERFANRHAISTTVATRFQCTAEHLAARCNGGSNRKRNIVAACFFCNHNRHRMKNPLSPDKYKAHIKKRIKKGKWHPKELHHIISKSAEGV